MPVSSRQTIIGSIAVSIAFVMELTAVSLLLPSIQEQFGLSLSQVAWVFNSYGIAVAMGVLLGGWFGDLLDTKKVFVSGVVLFASGSFFVASAGSFEAIVAGRLIQGLGGGIFSPLVPLLLTRASPHRPGRVLVIWGSIAGYVTAFTPLVFGSRLDAFGWELAFVVFALTSLFGLLIVFGARTEGQTTQAHHGSLKFAEVIRATNLWLMFGYVSLTYGAITFYLFRLPLWMSETSHDATSTGAVLSTLWLSFAAISTQLRNQVDGPKVRNIIYVAPVLIAAGFSAAYFFDGLAPIVGSAALVGAGLACSNAPSTRMILKFAPKGASAVAAGLDITFARLGGVLMVSLLATLDVGYSALLVTFLSAVALILVGLCFRGADRHSLV